jgi:hypothetical protein
MDGVWDVCSYISYLIVDRFSRPRNRKCWILHNMQDLHKFSGVKSSRSTLAVYGKSLTHLGCRLRHGVRDMRGDVLAPHAYLPWQWANIRPWVPKNDLGIRTRSDAKLLSYPSGRQLIGTASRDIRVLAGLRCRCGDDRLGTDMRSVGHCRRLTG